MERNHSLPLARKPLVERNHSLPLARKPLVERNNSPSLSPTFLSPCGRGIRRRGGINTLDKNNLINLSKQLRKQATPAERILWQQLRKKHIAGMKFRRQQSIGNYIVDFICPEKRLIVEIDGGQHNEDKIVRQDQERTEWLHSQGYQILRFWNNEVIDNYEGVIIKYLRS